MAAVVELRPGRRPPRTSSSTTYASAWPPSRRPSGSASSRPSAGRPAGKVDYARHPGGDDRVGGDPDLTSAAPTGTRACRRADRRSWPVDAVPPAGVVAPCGAPARRSRVVAARPATSTAPRSRGPRSPSCSWPWPCWWPSKRAPLSLDDPAGPPGSTVRHLLAHASGLGPDSAEPLAAPGRRRIYSNIGYEILADTVAATRSACPSPTISRRRARPPPYDRHRAPARELPGVGGAGPAARPARPGRRAPGAAPGGTRPPWRPPPRSPSPACPACCPASGASTPATGASASRCATAKAPHWTGTRNSPATFGHFGQAGGFLWVDPERRRGVRGAVRPGLRPVGVDGLAGACPTPCSTPGQRRRRRRRRDVTRGRRRADRRVP